MPSGAAAACPGGKSRQVTSVTAGDPRLGKMPNHRTHLRLHPVFLKTSALKVNDLPMRCGHLCASQGARALPHLPAAPRPDPGQQGAGDSQFQIE